MADTKTPRTDAVLRAADAHPLDSPGSRFLIAPAPQLLDFARQLELENADLTAKLARAQAALRATWLSAEKSGLLAHKQAIDEAYEHIPQDAAFREAKEAA